MKRVFRKVILPLALKKIILFIYFWLHWVLIAAQVFSLVQQAGATLQLWYAGFSLQWLLLSLSMESRHTGFSSCSVWAQWLRLLGSGAQTQQLWCTGLLDQRHVGSFWTRPQTSVSCIDKNSLSLSHQGSSSLQLLILQLDENITIVVNIKYLKLYWLQLWEHIMSINY